MKSLIIIPAYNEEACIEQTVRDITGVLLILIIL